MKGNCERCGEYAEELTFCFSCHRMLCPKCWDDDECINSAHTEDAKAEAAR